MVLAALNGFLLGGGLIIAIGAQNAFILRQGLMRQHVFILCFIASLADATLIGIGVAGFGTIVQRNETLLTLVTVGGVLFLLTYAFIAFRRALTPTAMAQAENKSVPLSSAISTLLAFTFLNPHVYLDTVALVGGISAQYFGFDRLAFGLGAGAASFVWFYGLGYGARLLTPVFASAKAWRLLDFGIAAIMLFLALGLASSLI